MTSNDFESNNKNKKNEEEPEMMEFTAIVESNRASKKKKVKFNPKVFLRSLLMTLLIAVLAFVGWRAGVFISDYITALNNGMSSSQALQYAWNGTVDFFSDMVDPAPEKVYEDKNILVIGSDKHKINADVIMLVHLDAQAKTVDIISVLRDTGVTMNNRTYKINASLQLGGEDFVVDKVEELLDVKIDNYVFLNYEGFRNVIDAIDGVDFYVPQNMYYNDPEQDLYINLREGQQHLDGDKAEQLVRFRQYPMGDVQRTQVQRDFITALYQQKLNSDLLKNKALVPALMDFVETDVSLDDAIDYSEFIEGFDDDHIYTHVMPHIIQDGSPYVKADKAGIREMFEEIEERNSEIIEEAENKKADE